MSKPNGSWTKIALVTAIACCCLGLVYGYFASRTSYDYHMSHSNHAQAPNHYIYRQLFSQDPFYKSVAAPGNLQIVPELSNPRHGK